MPSLPNTAARTRLAAVGLEILAAKGQRQVRAAVAVGQAEPGAVIRPALDGLNGGAARRFRLSTHISTVSDLPNIFRVSFQRVPSP